ncbi:Transketolase [Thelohanellus kitauei]|uniref:transketolase n=1 Tax=Thelohanellus kitauei TaxID=669202 RepID=A0A0C2MTD9_THEKT|nr:Transketolase [Thelohanellus kitauei]
MDSQLVQDLQDVAHILRIHSIQMTDVTGTGHPTSCSSIAEIISVLFFHAMKYSVKYPLHPSGDRFILSKGHAAPILYAAWAEAGLFDKKKLLTLRLIDSDLEGHPTPRLNFIDVATGSLGQGIGVAVGMAYDALKIAKDSYRVYCVLGDGECAEGSVWESLAFASFYNLHNFVAIVDINELGQSDYTCLRGDLDTYRKRWEAFGFQALVVDGHNVQELLSAFQSLRAQESKPGVILAHTKKGAFFPGIEGSPKWHGKALGSSSKSVIDHLLSLIKNRSIDPKSLLREDQFSAPTINTRLPQLSEPPQYDMGKEVATRFAAGCALKKLGDASNRIIVCDADVKNSTFTDMFKASFPARFIDCYIAEQVLVGVATGLSRRTGHIVFLSTFAAFLTRAFDQFRMAAISYSTFKVIGTHCGVSIGEDGGSQMGLEDLAMFRSLPNSVVLYPSDAVSAERAVELAAGLPCLVYVRTSRPSMRTIYPKGEVFEVGKSKICVKSPSDQILVIGGGVTLIEALDAAESLRSSNIHVRVMDIFSVKPIDKASIVENATECGNLILTVEDHYLEGGIGEAVSSCLSPFGMFVVHKVFVDSLPRSGKPRELLDMFDLSSAKIAQKIKDIFENKEKQ